MDNFQQKNIWKKIEKEVFIIVEIGKNFIQTQEEKIGRDYLRNTKLYSQGKSLFKNIIMIN